MPLQVFQRAGCTGRFCNVFIYIPITILAITTYGFMTATQHHPPECKYELFTGHFRADGLVTGLWIFCNSVFVFGYLQRRIMLAMKYQVCVAPFRSWSG